MRWPERRNRRSLEVGSGPYPARLAERRLYSPVTLTPPSCDVSLYFNIRSIHGYLKRSAWMSAAAESIILKGAHVIDPEQGIDRITDVHIAGGKVQWVGQGEVPAGAKIVDVSGHYLSPGWVDHPRPRLRHAGLCQSRHGRRLSGRHELRRCRRPGHRRARSVHGVARRSRNQLSMPGAFIRPYGPAWAQLHRGRCPHARRSADHALDGFRETKSRHASLHQMQCDGRLRSRHAEADERAWPRFSICRCTCTSANSSCRTRRICWRRRRSGSPSRRHDHPPLSRQSRPGDRRQGQGS